MTSSTITLRVDALEHADIAARAARDKISLSDYIRVRLGLRAEGPLDDSNGDSLSDDSAVRAQLADHARRIDALEAGRAAVTTD